MEKRKNVFSELTNYINDLICDYINRDKKVIIYGYSVAGRFIKYLLEKKGVKTEFFIDSNVRVAYDSYPIVYRPSVLDYIDVEEYIILSSIKNIEEIEDKLRQSGFVLGHNLIDLRTAIGADFYDYLAKNYGCDFSITHKEEMETSVDEECVEHVPVTYFSGEIIFEKIKELEKEIYFFDYGCGKGASFLFANNIGAESIAGIEIMESIYKKCCCNMEKLGIDCKVFCGDATRFSDIDEYNIFYFFNPFYGSIFKSVIQNIENSFRRRKRNIWIVYVNPFEHQSVIEHNMFKLKFNIRTDAWDPLVNVYNVEQ